jgi:hypothetical protein
LLSSLCEINCFVQNMDAFSATIFPGCVRVLGGR